MCVQAKSSRWCRMRQWVPFPLAISGTGGHPLMVEEKNPVQRFVWLDSRFGGVCAGFLVGSPYVLTSPESGNGKRRRSSR
jgi:hypothetical protein